MSGNSFGHLFKFTTFGESHGPAIGVVVDGVPPNIDLIEEDIQLYLDKRKPGRSRFTTQRREADEVEILSGVFEGTTTGRRSVSLFVTKMRAPGIMKTSRTYSAQAMRTGPILQSTATVITEEAAGQVRAKPPAGLPPAP